MNDLVELCHLVSAAHHGAKRQHAHTNELARAGSVTWAEWETLVQPSEWAKILWEELAFNLRCLGNDGRWSSPCTDRWRFNDTLRRFVACLVPQKGPVSIPSFTRALDRLQQWVSLGRDALAEETTVPPSIVTLEELRDPTHRYILSPRVGGQFLSDFAARKVPVEPTVIDAAWQPLHRTGIKTPQRDHHHSRIEGVSHDSAAPAVERSADLNSSPTDRIIPSPVAHQTSSLRFTPTPRPVRRERVLVRDDPCTK